MAIFLAYLLAGISTSAFVALWFWVVRRELYAKQTTVDAARYQLIASKQAYQRARNDPAEKQAQEILERSAYIYRQSVQLYNTILHKPWNMVPAFFLGFRPIDEEVGG